MLAARLQEAPINDTSVVALGSAVTVRFPNGTIRSFTLTNRPQSVDPSQGVISGESPLGHALLGKTVGHIAAYTVGQEAFSVEIMGVVSEKR
jgi:transcription elongation GreA/GreB family factor